MLIVGANYFIFLVQVGTKILVTLGKRKRNKISNSTFSERVWFLYEHIYTETANRKIKVFVR